jgi:signal peptidase I
MKQAIAEGKVAKSAGLAFERMPRGSASTSAQGEPVGFGLAQAEQAQNPADRVQPGKTKARVQGVLLAVAVIVIVGLLRAFVVTSFEVPAAAMERTLHGCTGCESDVVMVNRLSYRFSDVSRTDVVVFDRPRAAPTTDKELIRRVIGLPGETVSAHGGRVFIGAKALAEPYVNSTCRGTAAFAPVKIPAGHYFVMGDNRCASADSRTFGTVAKQSIVGRAVMVMWPTKHWRWL